MADEAADDEKTKKTVPQMTRTAKGVAEHAQAFQGMYWNGEKKTWSDIKYATLALFAYARTTANLLHEAEERLVQANAALDKRIAEFEARLTTIERFKMEAEAQTAEMVAGMETMLKNPESLKALEKLGTTLHALPPPPTENGEEKKGGAA